MAMQNMKHSATDEEHPVLDVVGLTKSFRIYDRPVDRLKALLTGRCYHREYRALDDVSFTLQPGETLGVLGRNGAGKSTLLKMLNRVTLPDQGRIHCDGRITALLELGTGFDPALSGRQNIVNNGLMIGMSKMEIVAVQAQIIEFCELGEHLDQPLRGYSSGMVVRLAFAIAIHSGAHCFLIDEALSVGDGHFQQKCIAKIREFQAAGGAIVFVSHDLNAVKMICDRVLVLHDGRVIHNGAPDDGVNLYNQLMAAQACELPASSHNQKGFGSGEARILSAQVTDTHQPRQQFSAGEVACFRFQLQAEQVLEDLTLGIMIRDRFGQDIFGTNSCLLGYPLALRAVQPLQVEMTLPLELAPGKYTLTAALHAGDNHADQCYHWCDNLLQFEVAGIHGPVFAGVCRLPVELSVHNTEPLHNARLPEG
ncbi:MAG: ABC transporter ATP-binding protein [Marinobacterium sp.]|nr:ABC transporter ATP-binding protein [Marinobacterium sp.]